MKDNKNSFLFSDCSDILEYTEWSQRNNKMKRKNTPMETIPKSNIRIVERSKFDTTNTNTLPLTFLD